MPSGRLRVLAITNLFPNNVDPGYAPFNRQQFRELGKLAEVEVFGVLPWRFGRYYGSGSSAEVVWREQIDGLSVKHPRYPSIPGLPSLNASLMFWSLLPEVLLKRRRFDVLLGSYAYPDGIAAIMLGSLLGLPVVVKCHGSDLNRVPNDAPARAQLKLMLRRADGVVVVSRKLGEAAIGLGVPSERIHVVYNGIDRERFKIGPQKDAREKLGLPTEGDVIACVGNLAEHKGTLDLLEAVPRLAEKRPRVIVAFIGDGPLMEQVGRESEHGGGDKPRVLMVGRVGHDEVATWMAAADVVCLPSWDEGMPNVVREAHAVGRPVVATRVGGVPEAVFRPELGRLVAPKDVQALADALAEQLSAPRVAPERIAELAIVPSWSESAHALLEVLSRVAERRPGSRPQSQPRG